MSSEQQTRQKSLAALSKLLEEVQPIIDRHVEEMDSSVAKYLLTNYSKYLKIDLYKDLDSKRLSTITSSPFDDIMEEYNNDNKN